MSEFDHDFLDMFEALREHGLVNKCDIDEKYIGTVALQSAHGRNNVKIVEYLHDNPKVRARIGVQDTLSHSTIARQHTKLQKQNCLSNIKNLTERAVIMMYADGNELPDSVLNEHDLPDAGPLSEKQYPDTLVMEELEEFVDEILTEVLKPLSYDRQEPQYGVKNFIGLISHLAALSIEPSSASRSARYICDDEVVAGSTLLHYIRHMKSDDSNDSDDSDGFGDLGDFVDFEDPDETNDSEFPSKVVNQFDRAYEQFFEIVDNYGYLNGSKRIVVDGTKISTTSCKEDNGPLISGTKPSQNPSKHGVNSWGYQLLTIANADSPFVLNIRPIYEKSNISDRLDNQLAMIDQLPINVELLIGDKDYYNTAVIKSIRKHLSKDWLICAEERGNIEKMHNICAKGESMSMENMEFGEFVLSNSPNGFIYPNSEIDDGQATLGDIVDDNENETRVVYGHESFSGHIGYVTDRPLSKNSIRELHVLYRRRASVESIIGQLRNTYWAPSRSQNPIVRYYFAAAAGLFYNIHTLVERILTPRNGLPLNVTGTETLIAIREACLS